MVKIIALLSGFNAYEDRCNGVNNNMEDFM